MYAYIKGMIGEVGLDYVVIEAAGVGYMLTCSSMTLRNLKEGDAVKLCTHLYLADGIMALYGFSDESERDMFRKLLGVTRVGPKLAIAILSRMTPSDICAAVLTNTPAAFDCVNGCGRKTAQRLILELTEVVRKDSTGSMTETEAVKETEQDMRTEAVAALTALGYDGLSATRAVSAVSEANSVEDMITKALRAMARG